MDDVEDFLRQMRFATLETSPLCEIPLGSFTVGNPVVHGPWPAAACAAVLRIWHGAGWIRLHYPAPPAPWNLVPAGWHSRLVDGDALPGPDAEALLDHPERWRRHRADGYVVPCETWQGELTPAEQWSVAALDTARRLLGRPAH